MSRDRLPAGWGPHHQTDGGPPRWLATVVILIIAGWIASRSMDALVGLVVIWWLVRLVRRHPSWWRPRRVPRSESATLEMVRERGARAGGGVYLGAGRDGWVMTPAEHAVLLLGPPRSGKTSGVIVPSVLAHTGPVVSTSTKRDVLAATAAARASVGRVLEFDPTGQSAGSGATCVRWSPVTGARTWDGALMMARAMVSGSGVGAGTTDSTHWAKRATALLAALLHAAALDERDVAELCGWVTGHEFDAPGELLEAKGARSACRQLIGLQNTEARERSSVCSAAMDALDAYSSDAALAAATDPNFDAAAFVRGEDTLYIHAPGEDQALVAPLICGLLAEIRRATYAASRAGELTGRVLWALDEAANIAPLDELPAIASEGGSQGLTLLASFQDLSQARLRWGAAADGFLTLFGSKLILPGVADSRTLESVSLALGEYDRRTQTVSRSPNPQSMFPLSARSTSQSTQRQRVLSPGDVANAPPGRGLYLNGLRWELVTLTPAYRCEPWRTLSALQAASADPAMTEESR